VAEPPRENQGVVLLQNKPNPFDEATYISVDVRDASVYKKAHLLITDPAGKTVRKMDVRLQPGINDFLYVHGYGMSGTYYYALFIDNKKIAALPMVFAN
jgi:hypothetical protein